MDVQNLLCTVEHKEHGRMVFEIRSLNSSAEGTLYLLETDGNVVKIDLTEKTSFSVRDEI